MRKDFEEAIAELKKEIERMEKDRLEGYLNNMNFVFVIRAQDKVIKLLLERELFRMSTEIF